MRRTALLYFLLICRLAATAQVNPIQGITDSCTMEISLLTCAPGTDLYSLFGHTAVRVQDTRRGMDIIYNYGTFDDTDPMFYLKFMRGIMRYSLSAETFDNFMQEYAFEHRQVVSQTLDLSCSEKNNLYEALRTNTLDENRLYDYHFHTDNCTTRAGRIIETHTRDSLVYRNILSVNSSVVPPPASSSLRGPGLSFRDMIHEYLNKQHADWSEFGIDLFLGSNLDKKVTNLEAIHFLPDYLFKGMDNAYVGEKKLVPGKKILLDFPALKPASGSLTPRALFLCLLLATILLFLFRSSPVIARTLFIFDVIFFGILGLLGILMASMWLGRVDDVCSKNINLLWAMPTHIVAIFFIRKKYHWIKYYFLITVILALILGLGFSFWLQRMNPSVLPLLGIIIFRGFYLFQFQNHAEKAVVQG